jgi:hypothetical protein
MEVPAGRVAGPGDRDADEPGRTTRGATGAARQVVSPLPPGNRKHR